MLHSEVTEEQFEKAEVEGWSVQWRRRKWKWALKLAETSHEKWSIAATKWQPWCTRSICVADVNLAPKDDGGNTSSIISRVPGLKKIEVFGISSRRRMVAIAGGSFCDVQR